MINRSAKLFFIFVAVLHGCASVPASRYYRVPLDFSAPDGPSPQSCQGSLRVARFHAIPPLRQDSIVTYQNDSPLIEFSPFSLWESSPPDIVSRKVAEAFRVSRLFSRVDSRPGRPAADYLIRGKILRFNQLETAHGLYGEVGLEVEFVKQENREILWSAVIRVREEAGGEDPQAVALAVSEALKHCILQIVQQVRKTTAFHQPMRRPTTRRSQIEDWAEIPRLEAETLLSPFKPSCSPSKRTPSRLGGTSRSLTNDK